MKESKNHLYSIGFLIGIVVVIIALIRGKLLKEILLAVLILWGIRAVILLLSPSIRRCKHNHALKQQRRKRQNEGITSPELFQLSPAASSPTEQLLLRHVNHRISAHLRSVYPDITWEWCEKSPEKLIVKGGVGRVRVFGVPEFDHADITIDKQANISCSMVRIVPLHNSEENNSAPVPPNAQPIDPQIWYEVQGRQVLETLVADLNSRGHSHLILCESGDVCVTEDQAEVVKEHLANFPKKVYWERLVQVFERNGLAAEITAAGIQVSW